MLVIFSTPFSEMLNAKLRRRYTNNTITTTANGNFATTSQLANVSQQVQITKAMRIEYDSKSKQLRTIRVDYESSTNRIRFEIRIDALSNSYVYQSLSRRMKQCFLNVLVMFSARLMNVLNPKMEQNRRTACQ